jgi:hypothetical protein
MGWKAIGRTSPDAALKIMDLTNPTVFFAVVF